MEYDATQLLPIVLACGTMLGMVSLRNTDIASRYRANVAEYHSLIRSSNGNSALADRLASLVRQNRVFFWRYVALSFCFIVLSASMSFVVVQLLFPAWHLIRISIGCFIVAILGISVEMLIGVLTLRFTGSSMAGNESREE